MTTKKTWKPYDVEQAKVEILAEGDRLVEELTRRVERKADEAIKRLEEQAQTFAQLSRNAADLFAQAEHIAIQVCDYRVITLFIPVED